MVWIPQGAFYFLNKSFPVSHTGGVVQDGPLQQVSYAIERSGCCQSELTNQVQV
jgi:hypothetical protein